MKSIVALLVLVFCSPHVFSQMTPEFERCITVKRAVFVDLNDRAFIEKIRPKPPAMDEASTQAELKVLHEIENVRTPNRARQAAVDANDMSMFLFRTIFGEQFNKGLLPKTAGLSDDLCGDSNLMSAALKNSYPTPRRRPFLEDKSLKLACDPTPIYYQPSFPSGHSFVGTLQALALIAMVPEREQEIRKRVEQYTENRLVCGVHFPSDVAAGREAAEKAFQEMLNNPTFNARLAVACNETRFLLGLPQENCKRLTK